MYNEFFRGDKNGKIGGVFGKKCIFIQFYILEKNAFYNKKVAEQKLIMLVGPNCRCRFQFANQLWLRYSGIESKIDIV